MLANSLSRSFAQLVSGIKVYIEGWHWLRSHPKYLLMLFVPLLVGLIVLATVMGAVWYNFHNIITAVLFDKPETLILIPLYYLLYALLAVITFILSFVPPLLATCVIASPLYEFVSCAVERDLTGKIVETSWRESLKLMLEELKKVSFIGALMLLVFVIPGLNVLTLFVPAFLLGWEFSDYPLARRGWSFRKRLRFSMKKFWLISGLGFWLMIPFLQFVLAPIAVVGGTIASIRALENDSDVVVDSDEQMTGADNGETTKPK